MITMPLDETSQESFSHNTWYLGYLTSNISGGLTTPLIPLFITVYLGLNVFYVGITSAIASAASVPALIMWGLLSDRYRRRKIFILIGFFGGFISLLPMIYVRNVIDYIAVLVAFQVVVMACVPVSTMILIENTTEDRWSSVMGRFNFIASIGTVLGLAGGIAFIYYFADIGGRIFLYVYVIAAFVYLVSAIIISIAIPEPKKKLERRRLANLHSTRIMERVRFFPTNVIHFFGLNEGKNRIDRKLKTYLFFTFFLMFSFQMFFVPYPVFVITKLNASTIEIYILYIMNSALGTITFQLTGRVSTRMGLRKMLGTVLMVRIAVFGMTAGIAYIMSPDTTWLIVAILIYGLIGSLWSFIAIAETASVSVMSMKNTRGKAIGYYNSLNGAGQIFGGLLSGAVSLYLGYSMDFLIAAIMVAVGTLMIVRLTPVGTTRPSVSAAAT